MSRKAGWDTHGLPVEIEVEKSLGITAKAQIEAFGVERFNALCRESVWKYRWSWEQLSERIGYWLDFRDPYVTYEPPFIESVWWALATLWKRGFLYRRAQDPAVLPALRDGAFEPRAGARLPGRRGPERLRRARSARRGRRILVWTTTPWTLVSNGAWRCIPISSTWSCASDRRRIGGR